MCLVRGVSKNVSFIEYYWPNSASEADRVIAVVPDLEEISEGIVCPVGGFDVNYS